MLVPAGSWSAQLRMESKYKEVRRLCPDLLCKLYSASGRASARPGSSGEGAVVQEQPVHHPRSALAADQGPAVLTGTGRRLA